MSWHWYLGHQPGGPGVSAYAAPARRVDLSGLPPAWIGVGIFDVLYAEDVAYAKRLNNSGVPRELHVVDGAFHGFDVVFSRAKVTRDFRDSQVRALRKALFPTRS